MFFSQTLSHCELITDEGIRHLSLSPCAAENLTVLELDNCPLVTDVSLEHLTSCHNLQRVELYDCQLITRFGIRKLRVSIFTSMICESSEYSHEMSRKSEWSFIVLLRRKLNMKCKFCIFFYLNLQDFIKVFHTRGIRYNSCVIVCEEWFKGKRYKIHLNLSEVNCEGSDEIYQWLIRIMSSYRIFRTFVVYRFIIYLFVKKSSTEKCSNHIFLNNPQKVTCNVRSSIQVSL